MYSQDILARVGPEKRIRRLNKINSNEGVKILRKYVQIYKNGGMMSNIKNSIINVHKNVPGSLSKINNILSKHNIVSQQVKTTNNASLDNNFSTN